MQTEAAKDLVGELREALTSGAFAHCSRVQLSDGVTIDSERMARIVLADFERIAQGTSSTWRIVGEEPELYDDLLCLLRLARAPSAGNAKTPGHTAGGLRRW